MSPRRLKEPRTDLFKNVRFFLDESVGEEERDSLQDVLINGGATKCPVSKVTGMRFDTQCTHVITGTLDMPEYEEMAEKGVHFVTTKWITVCYDMNQIHEPRFYSLDPKHIFSGVVVCCDDLPGRDADHVKAIVAAYGGQFRGPLTRDTTHLIVLKAGSDRYLKAMKHAKRLGMKVVLPHWVYDSLRAAMRVPERPFMFPDPQLFHPEDFDPKRGWKPRSSNKKQQIDDSTSDEGPPTTLTKHFHGEAAAKAADETWEKYLMSISAKATEKNGQKKLSKHIYVRPDVEEYPQIFKGRMVYLVPDLACHHALQSCLERRIKAAGGLAIKGEDYDALGADDMLRKADYVVTHYRTGWEYWTAFELNKTIGNIHWLIFCLATSRISGPRDHLLHYPVPKDPIIGFETVVATLTNYTGQERDFLKRLIETMGGTFDGELRSSMSRSGMPPTTLLVAAQYQGAKVDYAVENDITIVNHTWLERCFTRWENVSYTKEAIFSEFTAGVNYQERVGRHSLPKGDVQDWTQKKSAVADRERCQAEHEAKLAELRPEPSPPPRQASPPQAEQRDIISVEDSEDDGGSAMNVDSSPAARTLPPPTATAVQSTSMEVEQQLVPDTKGKGKATRTIPDSREQRDVEETADRSTSPEQPAATRNSRMTSEVDPKDVLEPRAGRAAKAKAAVGVSAQGRDMRAYEEQQRNMKKRRSSAAAELEDEADMLVGGSESAPPSRKKTKAATDAHEDSMDVDQPTTSKGKSKAKTPSKVKLCQTGERLDDYVVKGLKKLGVVEVNDGDKCTHMCLTAPLRNEKFLLAMCKRAHFVSHEWAIESVKAGRLLDEADYPVDEDVAAAEERARNRSPVFAGLYFHISSKRVQPEYATLVKIIEAAGGKIRDKAMRPWPTEPDLVADLRIISCEEDKNLCRTWLKQSPQLDIRIANYVLDTVRYQDIDYCDESTLLFRPEPQE